MSDFAFEPGAKFEGAARSGRAHEYIDGLVAACERAHAEIMMAAGRRED